MLCCDAMKASHSQTFNDLHFLLIISVTSIVVFVLLFRLAAFLLKLSVRDNNSRENCVSVIISRENCVSVITTAVKIVCP